MLAPYLDRPGAPLIQLTRVRGSEAKWLARQSRFSLLGVEHEDRRPWPVILRVRVGRPDGRTEAMSFRVDGPESMLDVGPATWLHPAADGRGYYVWSLGDAERDDLLDNAAALSDVEMVALLSSSRAQVAAGLREPGDLLPLVARFSGVKDAEIMRRLLTISGYVRVVEDLEEENLAMEAAAKSWTAEAVRPLLDSVGMTATEVEDHSKASLRSTLLSILSWAEDADVLAYATRLAEANLADPEAGDPQLVPWALTTYVKEVPPKLQQVFLAKADAADLPALRSRYLALAGSVRGAEPREKALALALDPGLPFSDMFALLGGVQSTAENDDALADELQLWVMDNHDAIAAKMPPMTRMFLANVSGCDMKRVERSRAFYTDPARAVTGVERILAESEARVNQCIAQREQNAPSVMRFLSSRGADAGS